MIVKLDLSLINQMTNAQSDQWFAWKVQILHI